MNTESALIGDLLRIFFPLETYKHLLILFFLREHEERSFLILSKSFNEDHDVILFSSLHETLTKLYSDLYFDTRHIFGLTRLNQLQDMQHIHELETTFTEVLTEGSSITSQSASESTSKVNRKQ